MFQGEECSRKQTALRGKVFQGAKCVEEQNAYNGDYKNLKLRKVSLFHYGKKIKK